LSKKYVLITNDVETTSILNHRLDDKTADYVLNQGMPRLLSLYEKFNVKATFFFTGHIAKLVPDVVKMIIPNGHEVGSHGYTHEVDQAFDVLTLSQQKEHLRKSKEILEDISGQEVISFRAPALRVNNYTAQALLETGPAVAKEAMACNCPVVSTKVGDLSQLFKNAGGYFLADSNKVSVAQMAIPVYSYSDSGVTRTV